MKKIAALVILVTLNYNIWGQCVPNSNSLSFNGTTSCANVPLNPMLIITGHITVEAWINASAFTTGTTPYQNSIVCHHNTTYGNQGYVLRAGSTGASTGVLSFVISGVDTAGNYMSWQDLICTGLPLTTNTWYHVAGTFDGDTERCYINGALVATRAFKGSIRDSSTYDLKIGRFSQPGTGTAGRYWNGKMDEVRIWNRALSKAEIDSNMNHHIDPSIQTGLVGYWRFNEGAGTTIADVSGNNFNGALTSSTWSTSVPFTTPTPVANLTYSSGQLSINPTATHYQWYHNGSLLPNDTLQSWHPTQSGLYYAVVIDANGCTGFSVALNITVAGLGELETSAAISILNNPVTDEAIVQLSPGLIAEKIELIAINGKTIAAFERKVSGIYSLSCNNFNDGLYLVSVTTAKGNFVKKMIIARE